MKTTPLLLALTALLFAPGCSSEEAQAKISEAAESGGALLGEGIQKLKDVDLSQLGDMSAEKLKEVYSSASSAIAKGLENVQDVADAEQLKEQVGPLIDKLDALKGRLGESMPSMDSVSAAIKSLEEKFADSEVMSVLRPLIDKLQGLMA